MSLDLMQQAYVGSIVQPSLRLHTVQKGMFFPIFSKCTVNVQCMVIDLSFLAGIRGLKSNLLGAPHCYDGLKAEHTFLVLGMTYVENKEIPKSKTEKSCRSRLNANELFLEVYGAQKSICT